MRHDPTPPCCISIRASRCGTAAFGAAMPLRAAMRAFDARNAHEASRALDELVRRALAEAGGSGIDLFQLGLPFGLDEDGLACPGLGMFTPLARFGIFDGIACARAALLPFGRQAPDGALARAWLFEDGWTRCMSVALGGQAGQLAQEARAQGLRMELTELTQPRRAPPDARGPARL